ncbi:MAG: amino acid permease [Verrucomicrobiales bacterium]|nr:amino acid permease [Verrucomicrobiales bacterium]
MSVPLPTDPGPTGGGRLSRRLGLFDATTAVIGGIVGAGIFLNPSVVARLVPAPWAILSAWILGGFIALAGAWIYAELGSERPAPGGQYAYFRDAFHPCVAFLYGWGLLWVIQSGGMAAVGVTFAKYFAGMLGWSSDPRLLAAGAILFLTLVNCWGVRAGASTQSFFTVLKAVAIAGLIVCGLFLTGPASATTVESVGLTQPMGMADFMSAMVPVLFAYGGWQTACFLAGEIREPERNLPRALVLGIAVVITLYLATNAACLRSLGASGLAATNTPASEVMRRALGEPGAQWIAAGIVVSTFGFLSQGMLTTPRVYYAMAQDGVFFSALGRVHPGSQAPIAAIILQGVVASIVAFSGSYETILNYVVSVDFIFYGLAGICVFVFRHRDGKRPRFQVPGHPWTTLGFSGVCWWVVANLVVQNPADALKGLFILALGAPVYWFWSRPSRRRNPVG